MLKLRQALGQRPTNISPLNVAVPDYRALPSPYLQPAFPPPEYVQPGYVANLATSTTFDTPTLILGLGVAGLLYLMSRGGHGRSGSIASVAPAVTTDRPERRPARKKRKRSRPRSRSRSRSRSRTR